MSISDFIAYLADNNHKASYATHLISSIKMYVGKEFHYLFEDPTFIQVRKAHSKMAPTLPKLPTSKKIWDIHQVLNHLSTLPHYSKLSDTQLARKTLMLLLLSTGRRKVEILRLSLVTMVKEPEKYIFLITEPCKNYSSSYNECQLLEVYRFPNQPEICPYTSLSYYIKRTQEARFTNSLFIVTNGQGTAASSTTLARWATTVMQESGIDTKIFKVHSTRAASMSAAHAQFMPLSQILHLGKWKVSSTFYKYYCRDIDHFRKTDTVKIMDTIKAAHIKRVSEAVTEKYRTQVRNRKLPIKKQIPKVVDEDPSPEVLPLTVDNLARFNQSAHSAPSLKPTELYSHGSPVAISIYRDSEPQTPPDKMADNASIISCGSQVKVQQSRSHIQAQPQGVGHVKTGRSSVRKQSHPLKLDIIPNPLATQKNYTVVTTKFNKLLLSAKPPEKQLNVADQSPSVSENSLPLAENVPKQTIGEGVSTNEPPTRNPSAVVQLLNQPPLMKMTSSTQIKSPSMQEMPVVPLISTEDIQKWTDRARFTLQKSKRREIPPIFMDFRLIKVVKIGQLLAGCVPVDFHQINYLTDKGYIVTCLSPNNVLTLVLGPEKFKRGSTGKI